MEKSLDKNKKKFKIDFIIFILTPIMTTRIMIDMEPDINIERKHKSKGSRRKHQKKTTIEKKELMLSRKKMSKLITNKINQRTINKVYEQFNHI